MVGGKKIIYDRHAKRRMKWRNISKEVVETVLDSPDMVESTKKERINATKQLADRKIKVTYKKENDFILIISAVDKND